MTKDLDILCDANADSEDVDDAYGRIQLAAKAGGDIADILERCNDSLLDSSCRALCLEALACARHPKHVTQIHNMILRFLSSDDRDLEFAGIACASDLPRLRREQLEPVIATFKHSDSCVGRAARVYCEINEAKHER